MGTPEQKIFLYLVIILSAIFHEYAHALAAYLLGDSTAKEEGRLTLNPIAHIDPVGTVLVPAFLLMTSGIFFGWAKPVPYNPFRLKNYRWDPLKIAAAGPLSNIAIALLLGFGLRAAGSLELLTPALAAAIELIVYVNLMLAAFNLLPLPPLDGSKVLAAIAPRAAHGLARLGVFGILVAVLAAPYIVLPVVRLLFVLIVG